MSVKKTLSPSEALYGFMGWLTTREEKITLGSSENCSDVPPLIDQFCKAQGLDSPREDWHKNLKKTE